MIISKVTLKNWKSHFNTELTFSRGVNVLIGEMGSGKTSVIDAIIFALYGTTPALQSRRTRIDNLIRRIPQREKEAAVTLKFQYNGDVYTLKREIERGKGTKSAELRKGSELLEAPNSQRVTELLENILSVDFELFSRAVYSEQNYLDYLLLLNAGERKKKVDELLRLDRFEKARRTLVRLQNRIKDHITSRLKDITLLKEDRALKEIPSLKKEVEKLTKDMNELKKKIDAGQKELKKRTEELGALKKKRENHKKLESELLSIDSRIETLKTQIRFSKEDIPKDIDRKIASYQKKLEDAESKTNLLKEHEKDISVLRNTLQLSEKEIDELRSRAAKFSEFKKIQKTLDELKSHLDKLKTEKNRKEAEMEVHKRNIAALSKSIDRCPVCDSSLPNEKRISIIKNSCEKLNELQRFIEERSEKIAELERKLSTAEEEKAEIMAFRDAESKLKEKLEAVSELKNRISSAEKELGKIRSEIKDPTELRRILEELKEKKNALVLIKELEKSHEEYKNVQKSMKKLAYKEEELDKLAEKKNQLQNSIEVYESRLDSLSIIVDEKSKRLNALLEKKIQIKDYEEEVEQHRQYNDFLSDFNLALGDTQVFLRTEFVKKVNEVMQTLWQGIYPYGDFFSIRLNPELGYLLQIKGAEGWTSVEGEVSGGERQAAALTLRIALALVLAPNLRLLILDEPTHNLDSRAVSELAETLRTEISNIMDQLLLITHDENLESSVTGKLYKLKKKETEAGLTEVEEYESGL